MSISIPFPICYHPASLYDAVAVVSPFPFPFFIGNRSSIFPLQLAAPTQAPSKLTIAHHNPMIKVKERKKSPKKGKAVNIQQSRLPCSQEHKHSFLFYAPFSCLVMANKKMNPMGTSSFLPCRAQWKKGSSIRWVPPPHASPRRGIWRAGGQADKAVESRLLAALVSPGRLLFFLMVGGHALAREKGKIQSRCVDFSR